MLQHQELVIHRVILDQNQVHHNIIREVDQVKVQPVLRSAIQQQPNRLNQPIRTHQEIVQQGMEYSLNDPVHQDQILLLHRDLHLGVQAILVRRVRQVKVQVIQVHLVRLAQAVIHLRVVHQVVQVQDHEVHRGAAAVVAVADVDNKK